MLSLLLQKYGILPVEDVGRWLVLFAVHYITDYISQQRQFDEEHGLQYDDLAHFGLTDADQRAYRATKQILDDYSE